MSVGRMLCAVAAAAAVAVASGCSSGPAPRLTGPRLTGPRLTTPRLAAPRLRRLSNGGISGYWTRSRLLDASPLRGLGYRRVPSPGQSAKAHPSTLALRVGALFVQGTSGNHFCTASVVASPGKDLLITAAHCISGGKGGGYRTGIVFIPDYRDGQAPYAIWTPARLLVAPQWISSSDPSLDVGFVVLKPHDGKNIEDILGANQLGTDSRYQYLVRVTGYPASTDSPITCTNWTTRQSAAQLRFQCGGFAGGTSGSPWVTHFDPRTRTGTIVGVIGGYQEGGDTPAVSYSSYLGGAVQRLYQAAEAASAS